MLLDYQAEALKKVREYAETKNDEYQKFVADFCAPFEINATTLINQILRTPITINFHPDRFSNNGQTIIENLVEQRQYHGQFRTGTTNGGRTAYVGGDRFLWEQRMFFDAYPPDILDRPKYGALNIFRYIDGASVRFGSCFFALKHEILSRCTFAYGDSHTSPTTICTHDTFIGILAGMLNEYLCTGKMLNQVFTLSSKQEILAVLLNTCDEVKHIGKNLDCCVETHIHGDIQLDRDIDYFYVDASFQNTITGEQANELCKKCGIKLRWIPTRQIHVKSISNLFRGPKIPILANRIDSLFGKRGFINAELIGRASRDSHLYPDAWADLGSEPELFQYFKQLWHTIGYFG